jgi:hypothetical protein
MAKVKQTKTRPRKRKQKVRAGALGPVFNEPSAKLAARFLYQLQHPELVGNPIVNPWAPQRNGYLYHGRKYLTVTIGTAGVGYIMVDLNPTTDDSIFYSGATFTGTTMLQTGTGVNVASLTAGSSAASMDNSAGGDRQWLSCGASLHAIYTGTADNAGGYIVQGFNDGEWGVTSEDPLAKVTNDDRIGRVVSPDMARQIWKYSPGELAWQWEPNIRDASSGFGEDGSTKHPKMFFGFYGKVGNTYLVEFNHIFFITETPTSGIASVASAKSSPPALPLAPIREQHTPGKSAALVTKYIHDTGAQRQTGSVANGAEYLGDVLHGFLQHAGIDTRPLQLTMPKRP